MQNPELLHQFSHFVPFHEKKEVTTFLGASHLPLVLLAVDFENGELLLKGDMEYLTAFGLPHTAFSESGNGIIIEADIQPRVIVDLENLCSNGMLLSVSGTINDGSFVTNCTGVLILQKQELTTRKLNADWLMSLVLYEGMDATREIRYDFPLYRGQKNVQNN